MKRRRFLEGAITSGAAAAFPLVGARSAGAADLPSDITEMTASTLSSAIRQRSVGCEEVMRAYLARIRRFNPVYNAIVSMLPDDECVRLARSADAALSRGEYWGWLHGMPHAVKDLSDVRGFPTSSRSPIIEGVVAERDSFMVARIRAEGALFIGKTNAPEFGMGSQTYNTVFGATGSACDPNLTAGGSSGGAASGLGTHMLPVADGGDLMGSLRNPGAFNNVIGFRPTQGRVPDRPQSDLFYQQMGTSGPMGRNTEDTIRLLLTIAGHNPANPLSLRDGLPPPGDYEPMPLRDLKIGWLGDYEGYLPMEPGLLALCESNLRLLEGAGVIVETCRPGFDMDRLWQTWLTLRHWLRYSMMDLYDDPETRKQLKPEAIWEIEGALNTSSKQIYEAGIARSDWFRAVHALFDEYDLLLLPTAQVFPFPKDVHWPDSINGKAMDTYHRWMEVVIGGTLAGVPVINVPAGFDDRGRPMGLQVMAPFGHDQKALEFAMTYESVTGHLNRRPALVSELG